MSEQRTVLGDVFRRQMKAFGDGDVEALMKTFAEGCLLRDMADPDSPYKGRHAVQGFLVSYFDDLANIDVTITTLAATEDTVIGELDVAADWVSYPFSHDSPRRIRLRYAVADTIRDGLVTYERFYWDAADLQKQLHRA